MLYYEKSNTNITMKIYRFLTIAICLLAIGYVSAESEQSLVVILKSGSYVCVPVNDKPKIEFDGTLMRVGNNDFQIEGVRKWQIGDAEEIISGITETKAQNGIRYKDGVLIVGNVKDVQICNTAGLEMPARVVDGKIDMTSWPQGIYVIKAGEETLKIKKQ